MALFFNISILFSQEQSTSKAKDKEVLKTEEAASKGSGETVPAETTIEEKEATVKKEGEVSQKEAVEDTAPGNVTMDFKDADINNVLRILSYKSGINIVAGKDVQGLVTIRLTNVPWEKALDVVLRTYGFSYEREGNIIRVTSVESLKQEELTTEAFSLSYAKAKEVSDSIKDMVSERGKSRYDERTNLLIVTDIPTNLYKIGQIVKRLDKKTPQVLIEARIIETELDDEENLGINWSLKIAATGASRPWTFPFQAMKAPFGKAQQTEGLFPKSQGATTTSSSPSGGAATNTTLFTSTDFPVANQAVFPFAQAKNFTFGTLDFTQFSAVLELLKQRRNTNILSDPRIATLNNKPASIFVGQVLNFPKYERNADTGTMEITGYTEKNLGIELQVTPNINDQGDIIVDLKPNITDFLQYDTLDLSRGIVAPRFATRQAQTQVMVKSGQTIMIGGLIRENDKNYKNKVPFLGDIPGINWFFTKTEKRKEKTELIFFVTVNLIEDYKGTAPATAYVPLKVADNLPYKAVDETNVGNVNNKKPKKK